MKKEVRMKKAIIKQYLGSFVPIVKTVQDKPATSNKQPAASNQQQATSNQQPATIFYLLILTLLFSGCEKVIDVDLNDADPHFVIEGNLSNNLNAAEVRISMTSSYFDTLPSEKVSGAVVTVESDLDDKYIFNETENGIYKTKTVWYREGSTYKLLVESNGEIYEATSKLNPPVNIDSVKFYYENSPFFESGYYINVYLFDPPGIKNFYRIKYLKNGEPQNSIEDLILFNDRYVDGNPIEVNLFNQPFELNDTITLHLISLDEGPYEYLRTFQEMVNSNPGSAAPANPNSNLSNEALGYFSAWSSVKKTVIIKMEE